MSAPADGSPMKRSSRMDDAWKRFGKHVVLWAAMAVAGLGAAAASGQYWHDLGCLLRVPAINPSPGRVRFLSCTNMPQRFEVYGAKSLAAEQPGWHIFTPAGKTARVVVTLPKMVDRTVFYPRIDGASGSVAVYEPVGELRKELFRLSRTGDGWTDIGAQYPVCLGCVEGGWSEEEFPVTLEIELQGQAAQLWYKDDLIFFEAP